MIIVAYAAVSYWRCCCGLIIQDDGRGATMSKSTRATSRSLMKRICSAGDGGKLLYCSRQSFKMRMRASAGDLSQLWPSCCYSYEMTILIVVDL